MTVKQNEQQKNDRNEFYYDVNRAHRYNAGVVNDLDTTCKLPHPFTLTQQNITQL